MELYRPLSRGASRAFEAAVDLWSTPYLNEKYRCGFNLNESTESIKKIALASHDDSFLRLSLLVDFSCDGFCVSWRRRCDISDLWSGEKTL